MEVAAEDGTVVRLPSGRARVVLAVLCAEAGREVTSDRLIDLAWNGNPPATSATQMHGLISALRRAFGPARDVIVTRPDGYMLRADVDLIDEVDAAAKIQSELGWRASRDLRAMAADAWRFILARSTQ